VQRTQKTPDNVNIKNFDDKQIKIVFKINRGRSSKLYPEQIQTQSNHKYINQ